MKICLICHEYPPGPIGGIGTMNQLLARGLVHYGHEVKVIGLYPEDYPAPEFEQDHGVEVYRIKVKSTSLITQYLNWKVLHKKVKDWHKRNDINIVEIPDSYAWFSLFRKIKIPLVIRTHGTSRFLQHTMGKPIKKSTYYLEARLLKRADIICAVSKYMADLTRQLFNFQAKIQVIYNGIVTMPEEAVHYHEELPAGFQVVFAGTLEKRKGVYSLVEAALSLLSKDPEYLFILNGKDTMNPETGQSVLSELKQMIPPEFQKRFIFNGHVSRDQLFFYYYNCRVAVFPSLAETFGLAPIEAMSAGIPTVFGKACAGPEIIENWVDGVLVNPENSTEISEAIARLRNEPLLYDRIAKNGEQKVKNNFSASKMVTDSIAMYQALLH